MALWYSGRIELQYNGVTVKSFRHYFKWIQAVNDLPDSNPSGTNITTNFSYITSRCNEPALVGDTILNPFVGDWNVLANLSDYISQYDEVPFANTGFYTIKFILPNGKYAIQNMGVTPSGGVTAFYESNGSLIGTVGAGIIYGNVNYSGTQGTNNGGVSMWFYKSYNGDTKEITPNKFVTLDYRPQNDTVYYRAHSFSTSEIQTINTFFGASTPSSMSDPYSPGGTTGPGGGGGDWRIINDPIDFPDLPSISVAEAGFISIWTPELSELRRLASFMWCADPLKIDFWKQMITNPIDLILGLQLLPFDVPAEGVGRVTLGLIDSKIDMHYTDQQFHEIDCGELELAEYWGAFLDYGPFTSLDIFLPYIGVKTLNVNDCMPKTIHVKYYVDIVTGTCVAMVKCDDSLFYHFNGSCASQVPVTSGQAQQLFGQALGAAVKIAAGAATGGIAGALASTVGVASAAAQSGGTAGTDRSGTISGTAGFMDTQTPYLIVTRPRQAVPEAQNELTGYPSFINVQLSTLEGYTEVQVAHLHNMSCTATEVEEITQLLQEGVIF